eukprot:gene46007-57357_t
MKKGLLTGLFTLCFAALVSAQVPSAVSAAFQQALPGTSASYVQEGTLWKAQFTQNGKQVFYAYTAAGVYQFKETTLDKPEVPAVIMENMEQRFSASNGGNNVFEGVAKRELADGTVHYEYQFLNGGTHVEVFYSEAGQIVKRNVFQ